MLRFKLGKIVAYIGKSGVGIEKVADEFFKDIEIQPNMPNMDMISSLFNEWLIFDYKLPSNLTISADYYLKHPDNLPKDIMDELKQIIETQTYEMFELEHAKPGEYVIVYSLFGGKRYRVIERTFSQEAIGKKGSFFNRIAKVNGDYYFVGSNPVFFPITHTNRLKRFYLETGKTPLNSKDALRFLVLRSTDKQVNKDLEYLNMKNGIKIKREELKKEFTVLKKKYKVNVSFDKLIAFVYNEAYKDHFADFYKNITKIGIPEIIVIEDYKFFQDLWNFFPHSKLGGECPADKYKKTYGV